MILQRTVAPQASLVPLSEAKDHLRVDHDDEDEVIATLGEAASRAVEEMVGRPLVTQTWKMTLETVAGRVTLPKTPVQGVTEIAYFDRDGAAQTAALPDFHVVGDDDGAFVEPKADRAWPALASRPDAISITFTAGYGDAETDVPLELRQAAKLLIGHFYEHRQAVVIGTTAATVPMAVEHLVGLHRRGWIA